MLCLTANGQIDSEAPLHLECEESSDIDFIVCDSVGESYLIVRINVYYYQLVTLLVYAFKVLTFSPKCSSLIS